MNAESTEDYDLSAFAFDAESIRDLLDAVPVGESLTVHFTTGLARQSSLQPSEQAVKHVAANRWQAEAFVGAPTGYDTDDLVDELLGQDAVKALSTEATDGDE
jgi:allophanate hydrolase subunit 1